MTPANERFECRVSLLFFSQIMRIQPFKGLVPQPQFIEEVAAVPYDVVDTAEAAALAGDKPNNLLHVDRAEIGLPPGTDPYSDQVYAKAAETFKRLQDEGILVREETPSIYLYKQVMDGHSQTGLVAACHIDDYQNDIIRKHEKTRQVKEDDRTRLVNELSANTGPIFLTYRDRKEVNQRVAEITANEKPLFDFTADDGVQHVFWRVTDDLGTWQEYFDQVPLSYVADGHHRSASAYRVGSERRAANPNHDGSEDYNWFLGVLFPGSELKILPYNRAVADLNGLTPAEVLEKVSKNFTVEEVTTSSPTAPGSVHMYLDGRWYAVSWQQDATANPVDSLDVSVLQERLLNPIFDIDDPRTNNRIDFIGGIRGTDCLEERVNTGKAGVAFSMYPVTVEQLMAIADADQIMPPKSTWFEPKLRSGLVVHTF
ncbi:MAG: hypothetical protein ACI9R3_002386 [Verrucomicrobiales bacterium]